MKPFSHYLNLGYGLCKCSHCKRKKPVRKIMTPNTAMRVKVKADIRKELSDETGEER